MSTSITTTAETSSTSPLSTSTRDRIALLSLLQGSEGIDWAQSHEGWDNDADGSVCDWEGISCRVALGKTEDGASHTIVGINLPNSGLSGTLPSQLGMLVHLQEINMRGNLIRGQIPQAIADLKELVTVDLTECQIGGTLPQHWSSEKLDKLLLGQNKIGGKFFHEPSPHLASITEINLEQNKLEGTLNGGTIEMMNKLETLSLSQNDLSGLLPGKSFGSLDTLKYLYLDSNHLVGSLSSAIAQQNKASLEELWIQDNALSGTIPASFVRLDKLHDFYIDGNKFTGLPEEICSPNINSDFFEAQTSTSTTSSGSEKTYCDSIACPAGSISLEGMHPCTKCAGTPSIARMKNPYLGQKGSSCRDWSQRDILKMFYEGATKKGPWVKEGNGTHDWLNDEEDMCQFMGVTCDSHGNVIKIGLKNKGLSGTISESIGFLQFLEELDVSDNDLTGFLPSDLRWTDLTMLDLSGNRIRGVVPPLLCLLEDLNGNGNQNVFHCDRIACPSGTYNERGRYYGGKNEEKCLPCFDDTPYIGQKSCEHKRDPNTVFGQIMDESQVVIETAVGYTRKLGIGIALTVLGSIIICCSLLRYNRQRRLKRMRLVEQRVIVNHTHDKYHDNADDSSSSSSDSSSSDDSDVLDEEFSRQATNRSQYKDDGLDDRSAISQQYDRSNYPRDSGSVCSTRSAPIQANHFIRDQQERSISKKSSLKNIMKEHIPRAREAVRSTVASVSNGVRDRGGRNARGTYDMVDADQYSTINFGSNADLEMVNKVMSRRNSQEIVEDYESESSGSSDNNRRKGATQYSDLLDVPDFDN